MDKSRFLLYGANGYTGQLIARFAKDYELEPVLAGRNKEALEKLSRQLSLPYRAIQLDDQSALQSALEDIDVVLHAAGPFHFTAKQMIEGCLRTRTHYIDINGDIDVFEMIKLYDNRGKHSDIMLLPGAGFDVVPTDCTALLLKKMLPDATNLQLAFVTLGGTVSHGTAMTIINKLGEGGRIRKNGTIQKAPLGQHGRMVDFGRKKQFVMSIPWGDVSTAHFTTGIPNIETFMGVPKKAFRLLKFQGLFNWLLRTSPVRNLARRKIESRLAGPTDEMRKKARTLVWGEARNNEGQVVTARFETPDGYTLTAHSSLIITRKILNNDFKPGYQTPAGAYGENLLLEIPGIVKIM